MDNQLESKGSSHPANDTVWSFANNSNTPCPTASVGIDKFKLTFESFNPNPVIDEPYNSTDQSKK